MRSALLLALLAATTVSAAAQMPIRATAEPGLMPRTRLAEWRRPLPVSAEDLRFSGEISTKLMPVFISDGEATRPTRLRLTYLSAVAAIPEGSRLSVRINDTLVGERTITAASRPETVQFDVPAGLLEPGFNAVRITVRQAHRVDCTRDASYELWTQILPEQSGLISGGPGPEIRTLEDLAAVVPGPDARLRIRVRAPSGVDAATLTRIARAVQATVVLGRLHKPLVEIDSEESGDAAVELVVGTAPMIQALGVQPPSGRGPRTSVATSGPSGRVTVIVTGDSLDELDRSLDSLEVRATQMKAAGSRAGLIALKASAGYTLSGGETIRLEDLGAESQRFGGRYYRQSAGLTLPPDFFAASYDRITLALNGAYTGQLLPGSHLVVRVNGAAVAQLSFGRRADVLRDRLLYLPLEAFKPGLNRIDIEAETLAVTDLACTPGVIEPRERFYLSAATTLRVPQIARVAVLPNLSALPVGGSRAAGQPVSLYLPRGEGEQDAAQAALTLLATIADRTGVVTPAGISFERPDDRRNLIVIGAIADLPDPLLAAAGLDGAALRASWRAPVTDEPTPVGERESRVRVATAGGKSIGVMTDATPSLSAEGRAAGRDPEGRADLVDDGETTLGRDPTLSGWIKARLAEVLRTAFQQEAPALFGRLAPGEAPVAVGRGTTLVIAQGAVFAEDGERSFRVVAPSLSTTVVTGPSAALLRQSLEDLVASDLLQRISGQITLFSRDTGLVESRSSPTAVYSETQPRSLTNSRLVFAGWLSRHPSLYVAALGAAILLLSGLVYGLVRRSGVRN